MKIGGIAAKESITADDNMKLASFMMQKKRKLCPSSPVLEGTKKPKYRETNPAKLACGAMKVHSVAPAFEGTTAREGLQVKMCPDVSTNKNLKSQSCSVLLDPVPSITDLTAMTVDQLKQIAKRYNLKGCCKLKKEDIARRIILYMTGQCT